MSAWFGQVDGWRPVTMGDVQVVAWRGVYGHDGRGTAFVVAMESATVGVEFGSFSLCATGHAVVPVPASVEGGSGLVITDRSHRGLFVVGGPTEPAGRLAYIDGCSDTLLVPPVSRGDPCLNLLHLPAGVVQSDHDHPGVRAGMILDGEGRCVLGDGTVFSLTKGVIFVLGSGVTHRFETRLVPMSVVAWHPDSDFGPTDDDHPMLNRTFRPGTSDRVR